MQAETTLVLGAFTFASLEIPEEIVIGGTQRLSIHELVGGTRIIDAMGRSDHQLAWSGLLLGSGKDVNGNLVASAATDRARYLDTLRASGVPQLLTWAAFNYLVVVREFTANYKKSFHIPYHIVCEVIADQTSPVTSSGLPPVDQAITDDGTAATTLTASIGDSTLNTLMAGLNTAIGAVSSFAHAAQSTINSVVQPLAAVQARVGVLITSTANIVANVTTFGGVLPGNPLSTSAAALTNQAVAMSQLNTLYQTRNVLGRMAANLGSINSAQNTVPTAGGNLFQIAQKQFGDAQAWTGIAKANSLTDPFVQGTKVLTIPPTADQQNGILAA
jgi:hypothetical protein